MPLNIVMMLACMLASVLLLPWWVTVIVITVMVAIRHAAMDQYVGMQICTLALPGALLGIIGLGNLIRDAETQGSSFEIGPILMVTVVPLVGFAVSLLLLLAMLVGVMLGWEWTMRRLNERAGRKRRLK